MVKILNSRLGNIFSTHSILQPSQFAGLPGGSTMSPINVAKQLIDVTTKKFGSIFKTYPSVTIELILESYDTP